VAAELARPEWLRQVFEFELVAQQAQEYSGPNLPEPMAARLPVALQVEALQLARSAPERTAW
jgi:hypothetical protein